MVQHCHIIRIMYSLTVSNMDNARRKTFFCQRRGLNTIMWSTLTHKRHNRCLQSCRNSEFLAHCNHQATITCLVGLAVSSRTAPLVASVRQQMSFTKRKSPEKTTTKSNTTSPRRSQHSRTDSTTTHLSPPKVRDWNRTLNNIIYYYYYFACSRWHQPA